MQGKSVTRIAGWDTHGLPVEIEIEKELGINGKRTSSASGRRVRCPGRKSNWRLLPAASFSILLTWQPTSIESGGVKAAAEHIEGFDQPTVIKNGKTTWHYEGIRSVTITVDPTKSQDDRPSQ